MRKKLIAATLLALSLAGVGIAHGATPTFAASGVGVAGGAGVAADSNTGTYNVGDIDWATIVPPSASSSTGYAVVSADGTTVTFYAPAS